MLRLTLITSLCLWLTLASAINLDSLRGVWNNSSLPDTARLKAIDIIAWQGYMFTEPDSAYYYAELQYNFAKSKGLLKQMAGALNIQGVSFAIRGDYALAMERYSNSLIIYERIGYKKGVAASLNNIGLIHINQENFDGAIEQYKLSLRIREDIGDTVGIAGSLNNIGNIYFEQNDFVKALVFYKRSLQLEEQIGQKRGIAISLGNIGNIYEQQGDFSECLDHYTRSLSIREEIQDKKGIAAVLNNIGILYAGQGDHDASIQFSNRSLKVAMEIESMIEIRSSAKSLYESYKATNRHDLALEMYELYIASRDSIASEENMKGVIRQEFKYKHEKAQLLAEAKHQEQMALSAEREKRQQLIAWSAGGGLVMVLAFAFFILNRLQVTRRQKKVIEEQKQKVEEQKQVVEEQKQKVEEQKKDITDSIRYAENIQKSLLPTIENLKDALPDGFILFQPKDIVSGDFYWMQNHKDKVYFAACDCTGHGVPGAFMSMIGSSLLDEAVVEKGITQPNEIFFEVRKGFINALKQTEEAGTQKDGMDAVLCSWNKNGTLEYSLAYNPLLLIRKGEILETKADKQPVGFHTGAQKPFTHHEHKLEKGDTVYLFSDGYPDQFGGKKDKKFMMKNFKKLLLSIQDVSMNEQKEILETTMAEWKGDTEQVDDILVMGVRF